MPSSESVCVSTEVLEASGVGVSAWVYNLEQISGFKTPDQGGGRRGFHGF